MPLLLNAASTDALHTLVQTINSHLFQCAQVAFKPQGATNTTYFDLEAGRLDPHWDLYIDNAGFLQATLNLWTRPYGHTGTTRVVASVAPATYSPSAGPIVFPVTGVSGDINALANVGINWSTATTPAGGGFIPRFVAYGFHKSPSYMPVRIPSTTIVGGGSVIGASGAIASLYLAMPSRLAVTDILTPSGAFGGRHRLLVVFRANMSPATSPLYASLYQNGLVIQTIGTYVPTVVGSNGAWQIADLGEFTVPDVPSGPVSNAATVTVQVFAENNGASRVASFAYHLNALVYIPLDISAAVVNEPLTAGAAASAWGPGETIDIRSTPNVTVAQKNASITLRYGVSARGGAPQLPPTAIASGPLTGIALFGDPANFIGNNIIGASVEVRERFSYLR